MRSHNTTPQERSATAQDTLAVTSLRLRAVNHACRPKYIGAWLAGATVTLRPRVRPPAWPEDSRVLRWWLVRARQRRVEGSPSLFPVQLHARSTARSIPNRPRSSGSLAEDSTGDLLALKDRPCPRRRRRDRTSARVPERPPRSDVFPSAENAPARSRDRAANMGVHVVSLVVIAMVPIITGTVGQDATGRRSAAPANALADDYPDYPPKYDDYPVSQLVASRWQDIIIVWLLPAMVRRDLTISLLCGLCSHPGGSSFRR